MSTRTRKHASTAGRRDHILPNTSSHKFPLKSTVQSLTLWYLPVGGFRRPDAPKQQCEKKSILLRNYFRAFLSFGLSAFFSPSAFFRLREYFLEELFAVRDHASVDLHELGSDLVGADHLSPALAIHARVESDAFREQEFSSSCTRKAFSRGRPGLVRAPGD